MSNKNKIQKLAELTTAADMEAPQEDAPAPIAESFTTPPNPAAPRPQLPPTGQGPRKSNDPAPQQPMLTQADILAAKEKRARHPVIRNSPDDPVLDETITAMLVLTGLHARWSVNHWQVFVPDAS